MSYNHHLPRDPITAAIRSSGKCRCTLNPLAPQLQALKTENILLRSRMQEGVEKGERMLLEEKFRLIEIENQKLHERIRHYQSTMEELENTHMELVDMVKREQKGHSNEGSARSPHGFIKGANLRDTNIKSQGHAHDGQIEGEYLISLKKLRPSQGRSQSPEERQGIQFSNQSTSRKPGIRLSYEGSLKRSEHSPTPQQINPEQRSRISPSHFKEPSASYQLQKAYERIRQLEKQVQQKTRLRSNCKTLQNQNELLKLKLQNIDESIKSYEESVRHYQSETVRLKKMIEDLKLRQASGGVTNRQNASLKDSNEYLKKQFEELEMQLNKERQMSNMLRQDLENEKRRNVDLSQSMKKSDRARDLEALSSELQRQKRTIMVLNEDLEAKSAQLLDEQRKASRYQTVAKQILQIRQLLESMDLSSVQHQERRTILQHKSRQVQLNHEVSILTSQLQRYKQQILLLQKKVATLAADKELITSHLQQAQKQNSILLDHIKNLQGSIDNYLKEEPLPSLKITVDEFRRQEVETSEGLRVARENIEEIIEKLGRLEGKLVVASGQ